MSFTSFTLHADLLRGLDALGFAVPTPIQKDAIPPATEGRDVLACAMTGSGKTAAFLLPILQRLVDRPRGVTRALVLAPTRELAAQIDEHRRELARFTRIGGAAVFGGVALGPQEQAFRRGADILVSTPGRLLDHLQHSYARLAGLEVLVLDEADRMLDMGFLPDIRRIMRALPTARRQTLLFAATLPPAITALARELLRDPVMINVERPAAPAVGVTHAAYPVASELKLPLLLELLRQPGVRNMLVFTRTKHRANRLADGLGRRGVAAERIHGNRSQAQRTQALAAFKAGACHVLVATDVAARGIDVTGLSHVVNFDVPAMPEDYIHRVGRTARMEAVGDAVTFVSPAEEADLRSIERAVGTRIPRVTLPGFDYTARATERLEVPMAQRIAAIRTRRAEERARSRANAARRAAPLGRASHRR
ncbi:MAG: RNA helicase [Candidatus Rokubacteria bacterium 13_1_40CM_69_27]|nr:MAG: RNA helicase [Candidatus Rokubacteria bacterium 13_1_40CM_69_27]OLC30048.1 MAG: RNA helicase [Candidatus Rokubacteria bacterium 13_1_40CM_4_69_5]